MGLFADERELGGGKPVRGNLKERGGCLGLGRGTSLNEKEKALRAIGRGQSFPCF
jgi:hypothetical protein